MELFSPRLPVSRTRASEDLWYILGPWGPIVIAFIAGVVRESL